VYEAITKSAQGWAAGIVSSDEIYKIGIRPATYLAMRRALEQISHADFALVDAWTIPEITIKQRGVIKGDRKIISIAAASIIAKVTRDRMMKEFHEQFPHYGFDVHKGYGTKVHRAAIDTHGPCPIHRLGYKTFSGLTGSR
jgi:ribonuclease HII